MKLGRENFSCFSRCTVMASALDQSAMTNANEANRADDAISNCLMLVVSFRVMYYMFHMKFPNLASRS